ncbi:ATP synthase peripheral stalk subunit F6, mitochondrial [Petromyzon marinus]|uniref:ATP synthase-coupling factor 6, mitochondrial n=1 Tax=Petromyzon marinus TaxID=7757 RepID=A0AAJ7SR86_PETMA|nr:ATP synthase-coupling factor 6, mitochondrial [Petromyzon marinus]XP_032804102.1 ATP synthase-coupling factor 6, mitochondrial [Petromyzon marinus]
MIAKRLFVSSTPLRATLALQLRRNLGLSAVAFNTARQLDPIQKLFVDKIHEYNTKSKAAGGPVDAGAEFQRNLADEMTKLQRLFGGGDLTKFPELTFKEPEFEEEPKK